MKILVKLMQFFIVLVMLYPVYYVWETDKIYSACQQIKPGVSYQEMVNTLHSKFGLSLSTIHGDYTKGDKWSGMVISQASFAGYACEIRGSGNQIAGARIIKGKQVAP